MPKAKRPDREPLELDDYSGDFVPDLHLSDFSKEALMKLVEVGGSIYGDVNRQWYRRVAERFGGEAADELHHDVWFADGGAGDHENEIISTLMAFADQNDETTAMKVWQCLPAMSTRMTLVFESIGDHEWEMHTPQCDVPEQGEAFGPEVMEYMANKICKHLELFGFRHGAARWNEKIRIDPVKLPPRSSPEEEHCRWTIKLTDSRVDYAEDPGTYVEINGLQRDTDAQIVNHEAGKYHRPASS